MGWDSAVQDTVTGALGGLLASGAIALVAAACRRRMPANASNTMIAVGNGNEQINNPITIINPSSRNSTPSPNNQHPTGDDSWAPIIATGIAMLFIALAYLAAWPYVLGFITSLALVGGTWATLVGRRNLHDDFPRGWYIATCLVTFLSAIASTVAVISSPNSASRTAERIVHNLYSEFNSNPISRPKVVWQNKGDIIDRLELELIQALAFEAIGVLLAGLLALILLREAFTAQIGADLATGNHAKRWKIRFYIQSIQRASARLRSAFIVGLAAFALSSGVVDHTLASFREKSLIPHTPPVPTTTVAP